MSTPVFKSVLAYLSLIGATSIGGTAVAGEVPAGETTTASTAPTAGPASPATKTEASDAKTSGEASDSDSPKAKSAVYVELLGNAGLYSLNYDHRLGSNFTLRGGFEYFSVGRSASAGSTSASSKATLLGFPIMGNYLVGNGDHHLELGVGILALYLSGSSETSFGTKGEASGVAVAGTGTVGYRYQPRNGGFLFKVGATPLFGAGGFLPWGGISFGGAF